MRKKNNLLRKIIGESQTKNCLNQLRLNECLNKFKKKYFQPYNGEHQQQHQAYLSASTGIKGININLYTIYYVLIRHGYDCPTSSGTIHHDLITCADTIIYVLCRVYDWITCDTIITIWSSLSRFKTIWYAQIRSYTSR